MGEARDGDGSEARGAFRVWLRAQSVDADAALAASLVYADLEAPARDAYLDALEEDASNAQLSSGALLGAALPLLAVETDGARRGRIERWVDPAEAVGPEGFALTGRDGAARVALLCAPVYLQFVDVLLCRYDDEGILGAEHEPMTSRSWALQRAARLGVPLASAPMADAVEELAHAVVAHRLRGRPAPEALVAMVRVFSPALAAGGS